MDLYRGHERLFHGAESALGALSHCAHAHGGGALCAAPVATATLGPAADPDAGLRDGLGWSGVFGLVFLGRLAAGPVPAVGTPGFAVDPGAAGIGPAALAVAQRPRSKPAGQLAVATGPERQFVCLVWFAQRTAAFARQPIRRPGAGPRPGRTSADPQQLQRRL